MTRLPSLKDPQGYFYFFALYMSLCGFSLDASLAPAPLSTPCRVPQTIGSRVLVARASRCVDTTGPIALLEGICRFVPSLLRIDPSAVALPPDADDAAMSAAPKTSEEKQVSSSGNRSNSRDGGYKLEWREFTSLAAAAGLPSATADDEEGKSKGNGGGDGQGKGTTEASTSTSKPNAEGVEARQPQPVDGGTVSGSGSGEFSGSAGVETEVVSEREPPVEFSALTK